MNRSESADAYLSTRSDEELRQSIARVNVSRAKLGLAPISAEAAARILAKAKGV